MVKTIAKFRKKGKRAAQIQDMAGNFASLCQSADGLVDHGIKYAGRHIFQPRSLIDERLDVGFCKYPAARSDGIHFFVTLG